MMIRPEQLTSEWLEMRKYSYECKAYHVQNSNLTLLQSPLGVFSWSVLLHKNSGDTYVELGRYPEMSPARALEKAQAIMQLDADMAPESVIYETVKDVSMLWLQTCSCQRRPNTVKQDKFFLRCLVFPWLGDKKISQLKTVEIIAAADSISQVKSVYLAIRFNIIMRHICRMAYALGIIPQDPTTAIPARMYSWKFTKLAAVTKPHEIGKLISRIHKADTKFPMFRLALLLLAYTMVRPNELLSSEWGEIDFDAKLWTIPAHKMKNGKTHLVPLSKQAISCFEQLYTLTGNSKWVMKSLCGAKYITSQGLRTLLHNCGYPSSSMTLHGFRSMSSTLLNERGVNRELIELQLSHRYMSVTAEAYNHCTHIKRRADMLQYLADQLDDLAKKHDKIKENVAC